MSKRQKLIGPGSRDCDTQFSSAPSEIIRLVTLHWEEDPANSARAGGTNFAEEANELRHICQTALGFAVDNFVIPSENPQSELHSYVEQTLSAVNQEKKEKQCPALIIFHYGGHGDPNDRDPDDQRRGKAVWAQKERGGPILWWGEIQETLNASEADILLIIDCCYAAHAARSSPTPQFPFSESRIQLLAASAEMTLGPGPRSFTKAFMSHLLTELQQRPYVTINEIHRRLCSGENHLYSFPILVYLISNSKDEGIQLRSLKALPDPAADVESLTLLEFPSTDRTFLYFPVIGEAMGVLLKTWVSSFSSLILAARAAQSGSNYVDFIAYSMSSLLAPVRWKGVVLYLLCLFIVVVGLSMLGWATSCSCAYGTSEEFRPVPAWMRLVLSRYKI